LQEAIFCIAQYKSRGDGLNKEAADVLKSLLHPARQDLIRLASVPEVGSDLVIAHIELMREAGESIPASLLALEAALRRGR
jgi:hypothetical protein